MKSVLWLNQFALLPSDGGGTRHFELGRELTKAGWRVTVFASDLHLHSREFTRRSSERDRSDHVETIEGVEFRWLWAARYTANNWQRLWNWLTFCRSALRASRGDAARPDIVIGSSPQLFAALAARLIARRLKTPFVFEVRDLWPESLVAVGARKGLVYWCFDRLASYLYSSADRVIVLARGVKDHLERRGVPSDKIVYVPNGVDTEAVTPPKTRDDAIAGPMTLVYAGAHGPANGLDVLLRAAEILADDERFRFLLVGDGPAKNELMSLARERALGNVEFRDPVSKPELVRVLNDSDAGLMLLRDATLFRFGVSPNKLFDYLAAGLPVVCNVPGEVADMVADAGAGIQATDASAEALAAAVREFARRSSADRDRMSATGREWVVREHGRGVLGKKLDGFLNALIQ